MLRVALPPIDTILLDVDGTLVDSNDAHAYAWFEALSEVGYPQSYDKVRSLIGMGADHLLPALDSRLSASGEPGKTAAAREAEIFKDRYLKELEPMPGARDLLLACKLRKIKCVVATSTGAADLEPLLEIADVADLIDASATRDDAEQSKPSPDIIHAALLTARSRVINTVMLGDTRFDVRAAHAAGIPAITLRCGGSSEADLADSAAIFDSPVELAGAIASQPLRDIVTFRTEQIAHIDLLT